MKTTGNTVSIVVTVSQAHFYKKFKDIASYNIDGHECKVTTNLVGKKRREYTPEEFKAILDIRSVAWKLGLMQKTRVPEVIVRRTVLIYLLKQKYSGPLIARALQFNNSTIVYTMKRYENLKRYRDYQEAILEISQHLKQCSLVDCSPETL